MKVSTVAVTPQDLRDFRMRFDRLRRVDRAAQRPATAEDYGRSLAVEETLLGEVRFLYDRLPPELRSRAWMLTSIERAA